MSRAVLGPAAAIGGMSEFRVHDPTGREPGGACPECGGMIQSATIRKNVEWDDEPIGPGYECQECGHVDRI